MKRLNRKGFTLVELLAVIVILAIVVGITLVTVLPTLNDSKVEAFNVTAQTAADYYEKEYQLYLIGRSDVIKTEANFNGNVNYVAAGLKAGNYTAGTYAIDTDTGRACVTLTANLDSGDYKGIEAAKKIAKSSACPAS